MTRLKSALIGAAALALTSTGAFAQSVSNGDFSTGSGFLNLNHLTDWSASTGVAGVFLGGNWLAAFAGNGTSTLSQTISGLTMGTVYNVWVDLSSLVINGAAGSLDVSVGGNSVGSFTAAGLNTTLTQQMLTFVASSTSEVLKFTASTVLQNIGSRFRPVIASSSFGVDNVSITAAVRDVPGPVAGAGLPFLIAGGVLLMRRRNART